MQCYALTRMLVWSFNPNFSKYGGSSSKDFFGVLLIYRMLNAGILLCSTKCVLFGGDLQIMRILCLKEAKVDCLQICKLNSTISSPLFCGRQKQLVLISLDLFLSIMTVTIQLTSTMQAIFLLLFNDFHRMGIWNLSIHFLSYFGWQEKEVRKCFLLISLNFF